MYYYPITWVFKMILSMISTRGIKNYTRTTHQSKVIDDFPYFVALKKGSLPSTVHPQVCQLL